MQGEKAMQTLNDLLKKQEKDYKYYRNHLKLKEMEVEKAHRLLHSMKQLGIECEGNLTFFYSLTLQIRINYFPANVEHFEVVLQNLFDTDIADSKWSPLHEWERIGIARECDFSRELWYNKIEVVLLLDSTKLPQCKVKETKGTHEARPAIEFTLKELVCK